MAVNNSCSKFLRGFYAGGQNCQKFDIRNFKLFVWLMMHVIMLPVVEGINATQQGMLGQKIGPPQSRKSYDFYNQQNQAVFEISSHGLMQPERDFLWDQIKKCKINPPQAPGHFVKVKGTQFTYDDQPFYFLGMNAYHLVREAREQNYWNIDHTFEKAQNVGIQVVRLWAFSDDLRQDLYTWNQQTFKALDSVIDRAKKYNLKVVLAFINYWEQFNGTDSYVQMVHGTIKDYSIEEFYSNSDVKLAYKSHVCKVVNRVNLYSGVRYRDDPTIMAWNLINEPRCPECRGQADYNGVLGGLVSEWMDEMAAFVKSIDPNHLVTTGAEGFFGEKSPQNIIGMNPDAWSMCTGTDFNMMHKSPNLDYSVMHVYVEHKSFDFDNDVPCGMNCKLKWITNYIWAHFQEAKNNLQKPVVIEEFGVSVLENFTEPTGQIRNFNRQDRVEIFKRILGLFVESAQSGGAGGGAMVWTAAVNHYVDYDGRTVYLDDEGTLQFESKNVVEWEQIPLLDKFKKLEEQMQCTLRGYGGEWIPTPLNTSSSIEYEEISGNNELEVFRSAQLHLEEAGMTVNFKKATEQFNQYNVNNYGGVVQAFSYVGRSIISDEFFDEFYEEFLPSRRITPFQPSLDQPSPSPETTTFPQENVEDIQTLSPPTPISKEKKEQQQSSQNNAPVQEILNSPQLEPSQNTSTPTPTYFSPPPPSPLVPSPSPPSPVTLSPPPPHSPPPPSPSVQSPPPPSPVSLPPPPLPLLPILSPQPQPQDQPSSTLLSSPSLLDQSPPPLALSYLPLPSPPNVEPLPLPLPLPPPPDVEPLPPPLDVEPTQESYTISPQNMVSMIQSLLPDSQTSPPPPPMNYFENDKQMIVAPPSPNIVQSFSSSELNYEEQVIEYETVLESFSYNQYSDNQGGNEMQSSGQPPPTPIQVGSPPPMEQMYNFSTDSSQYQNDGQEGKISGNDNKDVPVQEGNQIFEDKQMKAPQKYQLNQTNNSEVEQLKETEDNVPQTADQMFAYIDSFSDLEIAKTSYQGECSWRRNANLKGQVLKQLQTESIEDCCSACQNHSRCNVYVFCPKGYGCHNNGEILPYTQCDLKFQQVVLEGKDPEVWQEGPTTHLTSGYINYKGGYR